MNKDLVELVFIVDRSGSMSGLEEDTVGGINTVLKEQKNDDSNCVVSTVFFNDKSTVILDRVSLKEVEPLQLSDYHPAGSTALIDAIGDSIKYIKKVHKIVRKEDKPARTMFVITTDGMENSSHKYNLKEVKRMIEAQKEDSWEFIFLGANIDSFSVAEDYGFSQSCVANYVNDSIGNKVKYRGVNKAVSQFVKFANIEKDCLEEVNADYKARK